MTRNNDFIRFIAAESSPTPVNGTVVGYFRYSARRPEAAARQRALIEDYAMRVFGQPLDAVFEDVHGSGTYEDRPGLTALKEEAQKGEIAAIVVEDIERVARHAEGVAEFDAFCEMTVIKLHTAASGPRDPRPHAFLGHDEAEMLQRVREAADKVRSKATN